MRKNKRKYTNLFFHFSSHPLDAWKFSIFNSVAKAIAFSFNKGPFKGMFSLRQFKSHFIRALFKSLYFSGRILLFPKPAWYASSIFVLFLFQVESVLFWTPKRKATSIWGPPFSSSLRASYLFFIEVSLWERLRVAILPLWHKWSRFFSDAYFLSIILFE